MQHSVDNLFQLSCQLKISVKYEFPTLRGTDATDNDDDKQLILLIISCLLLKIIINVHNTPQNSFKVFI